MKRFFKIFFKVLFFLLLIGVAISLILIGLHYSKISKKHYVFSTVVDNVFEKGEKYLSIPNEYNLGDNFQVEGTVKMKFSSEDYLNKSKNDPEYKKKYRKLENLSKVNTTYLIQHDKKNEKVYAEVDEKLGKEELFHGKYLVSNSTKYIFVEKILNNYINDGAANYFETYVEDVNTTDNVIYLYNFIRDSIKNNITEDDLIGYDVETLIGEETKDVGQISYKIDDKSYKELLKNILKDIKKDARAKEIVSLIYPNFEDLKVNEKKHYLKSNESYTFNIYTTKLYFKPVKYEVVYLKDDQKEIYTYEGDMKKGVFYYSENNEIKYQANIESTNKKTNILVYDDTNNEVGTIKLEKDENSLMFTMTLDLETKKYDVSYSMKNKDLEKNKYNREDYLSFKVINDKVTKIEGNIELNSKISKDVKINEDTTSSVLRSSLKTEDEEKLQKLHETIEARLEK